MDSYLENATAVAPPGHASPPPEPETNRLPSKPGMMMTGGCMNSDWIAAGFSALNSSSRSGAGAVVHVHALASVLAAAHWPDGVVLRDLEQLKALYSDRFTIQGQKLADWWPRVESEIKSKGSRELQIKDLSVLQWRDQDQTMVVTFGEVAEGARRGTTKRQYWIREDARWKIFYDGHV